MKIRWVRIKFIVNFLIGWRRFIIESLSDEFKDKRRKIIIKKIFLKENLEGVKENICCKRGGFFGFRKGKVK